MPLGKDSLEGGGFIWELVLAAPGLELRSVSAPLGSWGCPRASDSKQLGRKPFQCPGQAGMEPQEPCLNRRWGGRKGGRTHRLSSGDRLSLKKEQFWLSISASLEERETG